MKNKMKRYMGVLLLSLIAGGFLMTQTCQAASAEVELTSDTAEVTVGDSFLVYITINSESLFDDFEANVIYDDNMIEYKDGTPVISGSSGFLKILDMGVTEGSLKRKYTMKFEALQAGIIKVSFNNPAVVYEYETGSVMSVSSNDLSMKVSAKKTASTNANLASLKISPSEIQPAFNAKTFEYTMNVGYETEQLIIDALPEDKKATVSINGNDFLKEGENKVIITVLAESGAVIEYTINVNREAAPENTKATAEVTGVPEATQNLFEVIRIEDQKYVIYSGKYYILEPDGTVVIPKGYLPTKLIISGISIEAFYPEKDLESDFYLIYARNGLGEEGFYKYDKIEKTLQRYVVEDVQYENVVSTENNQELINEQQAQQYHSNLTKVAIIIAVLSALCALLFVFVVLLLRKAKRSKKEELD